MKVEQFQWTGASGWRPGPPGALGPDCGLVLVFGAADRMGARDWHGELRRAYPKAVIAGCTTAGEIAGARVSDDSVVATAVSFSHTRVQGRATSIRVGESSRDAGRRVAELLPREELRHVLVFSDGLEVNGTDLVQGLAGGLPPNVAATGGLSGDGARFKRTQVLLDGPPAEGAIVLVGFYGGSLRISHGCMHGWDPFGPERVITRSSGNVLYELDGQSALGLYKRYLGDQARDLPASGLRFPLLLRTSQGAAGVVRTILSVDEATQSMTFAGDVPQGSMVRLMKASFDRLVEGAQGAARSCLLPLEAHAPDWALLISCVGRKLVLQQRIDDEIEAVRQVLGEASVLCGFYSYGEISPLVPGAACGLHNQTMTITAFSEP